MRSAIQRRCSASASSSSRPSSRRSNSASRALGVGERRRHDHAADRRELARDVGGEVAVRRSRIVAELGPRASRSAGRSPRRQLGALVAVVHRPRERLAQPVDEEAGAEDQLEDPEQPDRPGAPSAPAICDAPSRLSLITRTTLRPAGLVAATVRATAAPPRLVAERDVDGAGLADFAPTRAVPGEARSISHGSSSAIASIAGISPADPLGLGSRRPSPASVITIRARGCGARVSPQPGDVDDQDLGDRLVGDDQHPRTRVARAAASGRNGGSRSSTRRPAVS